MPNVQQNFFSKMRKFFLIQNLPFGDSVQTIGQNAFNGCTALKTLKLPSELQTLGRMIFLRTALEEFDISTITITPNWNDASDPDSAKSLKHIININFKDIP